MSIDSGTRVHRSRGAHGSGVLLVSLGVIVGWLAAMTTDRVTELVSPDEVEIVRAVRDLARDEFVGEVDDSKLIDDALRGMLSGLDRYSRFYAPDELARLDRETLGEFRGIGVVFLREDQGPTGQVLFAFEDSPAGRAGIRVGDRFVSIDGKPVEEMTRADLQRTIQEARSDVLETSVEDLSGARRQVEIGLERILDPTVRHARILDEERGIGYLAILSFTHRTPEEFDRALADLERRGMKSLILDLRDNPGGILGSAVQIANRFVEGGALVRTRTPDETDVIHAVAGEARQAGMPLVVLVDGDSASASEVLAGALQDHAAAVLVGHPTYGKGTVQTLRRLRDDRGVVKLTTAVYHTPSDRPIERWNPDDPGTGITPDFWVEVSAEESAATHAFLNSYSPPPEVEDEVRRWEERDQKRLLDPQPEDRQLDAARDLLAPAR